MTTSYRNIRKIGKARWMYECPTCGSGSIRPDLFRALEAKQQHQLTSAHVFKAMAEAFRPLVDAFVEAGQAAMEAVKPFMALSAAPMNRPHDPALLGDKRKWGGR